MKVDHVLEGSGGEITAGESETLPPSYIFIVPLKIRNMLFGPSSPETEPAAC